MYKERSGLNIQKDVYKKRDFCKNPESEAAVEPIIDKFGEELVEHKSLNLMNQMLPSQVSVLGKRDKPEEETTNSSALEPPKKKVQSYAKFNKEQKEQAESEELLAKFLVVPKLKFSDLGGLEPVIKQL
jgi:hypothetical protein